MKDKAKEYVLRNLDSWLENRTQAERFMMHKQCNGQVVQDALRELQDELADLLRIHTPDYKDLARMRQFLELYQ